MKSIFVQLIILVTAAALQPLRLVHSPRCSAVVAADERATPGDPSMKWAISTKRVRSPQDGREEVKTMLDCSDPRFVVRTVNVTVPFQTAGLGLELTELCGTGENDLGEERSGQMVLISGVVEGGGAEASGADVRVGDTIVGIDIASSGFDYASVEAVGYDELVGTLRGAMDAARSASNAVAGLQLSLKRIMPRGVAKVRAIKANGEELVFNAYEGENLRMGLIRNGGGRAIVNDMTARRYDNKPRGTGDCGGNGICATCVVSIMNGKEHLSPMKPGEKQLLRNVARWRQSCRAYLALEDGEEAEITVKLSPRSEADE